MRKLGVFVLFGFLSLNAFEMNINMGAGYYYTGANGNLIYTKDFWKSSSAKIKHASSATFYTWAEIETDQHLWPKLRVEFNNMQTQGESLIHISSTPEINALISGIESNLPVRINNTYYDSSLVENTIDAYLYYEFFQETEYPSVGFGVGVKNFDFTYRATIIDGLEFTDNGGDTIPMLYLKSRYTLDKEDDGEQFSLELNAKAYVFGESNIYDYTLKVDFLMPYNATTDLGLELGYKETVFDIKGSDIKTVGGDMTTSGVFFGVVGHFR